MRPGQHHLSFVVSCGGAALRPRGQLPPLSALLPCSQSSRRSGLKPMTGNSTRPAVLPVSPSSASLPRQTQPAVLTVNSPPPQRNTVQQNKPTSQLFLSKSIPSSCPHGRSKCALAPFQPLISAQYKIVSRHVPL